MLKEIYRRLEGHFGFQDWWPGETAWEVVVGAILTQNTAWRNVEKAIDQMKQHGLFSPKEILEASPSKLESAVRSSGYYRQKARRLLGVAAHIRQRHRGSLSRMLHQSPAALRRELLTLPGIGPETADDILLYAAGRATFVVDAYTVRALERLGLAQSGGYEGYRRYVLSRFGRSPRRLQEFHALFVVLGKQYCKKEPRCVPCPLLDLCPTGRGSLRRGPIPEGR